MDIVFAEFECGFDDRDTWDFVHKGIRNVVQSEQLSIDRNFEEVTTTFIDNLISASISDEGGNNENKLFRISDIICTEIFENVFNNEFEGLNLSRRLTTNSPSFHEANNYEVLTNELLSEIFKTSLEHEISFHTFDNFPFHISFDVVSGSKKVKNGIVGCSFHDFHDFLQTMKWVTIINGVMTFTANMYGGVIPFANDIMQGVDVAVEVTTDLVGDYAPKIEDAFSFGFGDPATIQKKYEFFLDQNFNIILEKDQENTKPIIHNNR